MLIPAVSCTKDKAYCGHYIKVASDIEPGTKGGRLTKGNLAEFSIDVISGGSSSWAGEKGSTYLSRVPVRKSGSDWLTYNAAGTAVTEYSWVDNVMLYFWSHSPAKTTGKFEVSSQSADGKEDEMVFSFTPAADPADQEDLLLGFNGELREFDATGEEVVNATSTNPNYEFVAERGNEVKISLHHALSEVSFCVSTDDDTFSADLSILSIQLSGIAAGGSCTFLGEPDEDETFFNWTPSADTTSYKLVLNTDFASDPASDDEQWSTGSYTMTSRGTHNLFTTKNCLYIIPQDMSKLAKPRIKVTFKRTSNGEVATKEIALGDNLAPGKYYKYKIKAQKVGADIFLSYVLIVNDWLDGTDTISL